MSTKQITPLADGRFELRYQDTLVGYVQTEAEAKEKLDEIAYDHERGGALPTVETAQPFPEEYWKVRTPIATLSNGDTVYGTHDRDGMPFSVTWEGAEGHFFAAPDGIAGTWAGVDLEMDPLQLAKLRRFFTGNIATCLIELAQMWTGEEWESEDPIPGSPIAPALIHATVALQKRLWPRLTTYDETHEIILELLTSIENDLGTVAYRELPVLEAIWDANHPEYVAEREREAAEEEEQPPVQEAPPEPTDPYTRGYQEGRRDMLHILIRHIEESIEDTASEEVQDGILDGLENAAKEIRSRKHAA